MILLFSQEDCYQVRYYQPSTGWHMDSLSASIPSSSATSIFRSFSCDEDDVSNNLDFLSSPRQSDVSLLSEVSFNEQELERCKVYSAPNTAIEHGKVEEGQHHEEEERQAEDKGVESVISRIMITASVPIKYSSSPISRPQEKDKEE